jgi:hypothetical protein
MHNYANMQCVLSFKSIHHRYTLSDLIIQEELQVMPGLPQCDYIMLTNGDNIYSNRLISVALPYMRDKVDLIG